MRLDFFNKIYLGPNSCRDINITAMVNNTKPRTEMQSEIIEIQFIKILICFLKEQAFLICQQTYLLAVTWVSHELETTL